LINNAIVSLPFCYRAIWKKDSFGNGRMAKKAMVSLYEDILIFQNKCPNKEDCEATMAVEKLISKYGFYEISDLMLTEGRYKTVSSARNNLTKKRMSCFQENCYDNFFDEKMLLFLADKIDLGFSIDWYLQKVKEYKQKNAMTFNLWQGGKSKSNVLEYKKDNDGYHPTQKPVALLEDLIQTYSNEGNTVLDFTMGSGSTGVACVNTNRHFVGIELDEGYFNIAKKRIEEAYAD
jgi:site-specific DNA-methyltransferase (adenine-specific)